MMTESDIDIFEARIDGALDADEAQDAHELLRLARRGLRAEREICGSCAAFLPGACGTGLCCGPRLGPIDSERGYCDAWRAKRGVS